MEPELGAEQLLCGEDSVMRLRLSTPFEPYGRYTADVRVGLSTGALRSAEGEALRARVGSALERETAQLLRRIRRADRRRTATAAERIAAAQVAQLLGPAPNEEDDDGDDNDDELGGLALEMDIGLSPVAAAVQRRWERPGTPLAEQWVCAVAAAAAAARSGLPGARDEARAERARAMVVQTAADFAAVAVRAARARVAGVRADLCAGGAAADVVLETPDPGLDAPRYGREAKTLKKTFGVLSHALTAALTAADTAPARACADDRVLLTTVPCAVLVEYCGATVLATLRSPRGAAVDTADARERATQYLKAAPLRDAAEVPAGVSAVQWTPSRDDGDEDEGALPAFCFVLPNWRLLERLPPVGSSSSTCAEAPHSFVRPEVRQCRKAGVDETANLLKKFPREPVLTVFVEEVLHMHGVSMRDLNRVRQQLGSSVVEQLWAQRIKVEMVARAFHKIVNEALRASMRAGFSEAVAREVVAAHFSALLAMNATDAGTENDGMALWDRIVGRCEAIFGITDPSDLVLSTDESGGAPDSSYTVLLFRRASELLGVEWCAATAAVLTGDPAAFDTSYRVTFADIAALHPRVKQMHWVLHAQGLLAQAQHRSRCDGDGDGDGDGDNSDDSEDSDGGQLAYDDDEDDDDDDYEEGEEVATAEQGRRACVGETVVQGVAGALGEAELLAALRQEPRCVATLRALGQCYRARWMAQRQRAQSTASTQRALQWLADMFLVLALQCSGGGSSDARALLDLAVLEDQRWQHQRALQLCVRALEAGPASPAALALCGDLMLVPNFRVDPAAARRCHLSAIAAAAARLVPCPYAKINRAVACLRSAADARAAGDVCALCEEAGAALLRALNPADSGDVPAAALLWDLAEYARAVLARPDLAAVLRRVLALCHPRSPLARAAPTPVLSGSVSPAGPASPAAPTAPAQPPV